MDITTVIAISKMIEAQLLHISRTYEAGNMTDEGFYSASGALSDLESHLACYINNRLNAEENKTVE